MLAKMMGTHETVWADFEITAQERTQKLLITALRGL